MSSNGFPINCNKECQWKNITAPCIATPFRKQWRHQFIVIRHNWRRNYFIFFHSNCRTQKDIHLYPAIPVMAPLPKKVAMIRTLHAFGRIYARPYIHMSVRRSTTDKLRGFQAFRLLSTIQRAKWYARVNQNLHAGGRSVKFCERDGIWGGSICARTHMYIDPQGPVTSRYLSSSAITVG